MAQLYLTYIWFYFCWHGLNRACGYCRHCKKQRFMFPAALRACDLVAGGQDFEPQAPRSLEEEYFSRVRSMCPLLKPPNCDPRFRCASTWKAEQRKSKTDRRMLEGLDRYLRCCPVRNVGQCQWSLDMERWIDAAVTLLRFISTCTSRECDSERRRFIVS